MINNDYFLNEHLNYGLKAMARKLEAGYNVFEAIQKRSKRLNFRLDTQSAANQLRLDGRIIIPSMEKLRASDNSNAINLRRTILRTLTPMLSQKTDFNQKQFLEMEIAEAKSMISEIQNHNFLQTPQHFSSISVVDEGLFRSFFLDAGVQFLNKNWYRFNRPCIVTLSLGEMSSFSSEEFREDGAVLARTSLFKDLITKSTENLKTFALGGLIIKPVQSENGSTNNLTSNKLSGSLRWTIEYKIILPRWEVGAFLTAWQKTYKGHGINNAVPVVEVVDYAAVFVILQVFQPLCTQSIIQVPKQKLNNNAEKNAVKRLDPHNRLSLFRALRNLPLSLRVITHNVRIVEKPKNVEFDFIEKISRDDDIYFDRDLGIADDIEYNKVGSPLSLDDEFYG